MPFSITDRAPATAHRALSGFRPISAFVPAVGVRHVTGLHRAAGAARPALSLGGSARPASPASQSGISVDLGADNIALSVRLTGAFVIVAFLAGAGAFVTNLQIASLTAPGVDVAAAARMAQMTAFAFAGVVAAVAIGLGLFIARSIATPVQTVTDVMERLAAGDLDARLPERQSADEIGRMTRAIKAFRDQAIEHRRALEAREADRHTAAAEQARMRQQLADEVQREIGAGIAAMGEELDGLRTLSRDLLRQQEVAVAKTGEVDVASQDSLALAEGFSAAVERLTAATSAIRQRVEQTTQVSSEAAGRAEAADADIEALVQAADSITRVIDLISNIAGQTKILALNAQVEAMRAGKAGASFIVVAEEVKALSTQTSAAVEEVSAQVAAIRKRTSGAAHTVRAIIENVASLDSAAREISDAVDNQLDTARSIEADAQAAREGGQSIRNASQTLNDAAAQSAEAAINVDGRAEALGGQAERLETAFEQFLSRIRAENAA